MAGHHKSEIERMRNALRYSLQGLVEAFRCEGAFRTEVLLACILIPSAFFVSTEAVVRALLVGSVLILMVTELLNSGIEAAVDRISMERHELAKRAKDIGSAAVFVAVINVTIIWLLVIFTE